MLNISKIYLLYTYKCREFVNNHIQKRCKCKYRRFRNQSAERTKIRGNNNNQQKYRRSGKSRMRMQNRLTIQANV